MTDPLNPNFKPGVGRLATDRYDFASHYEGVAFKHTAGQIVVSPALTIGSATVTDVQTALAALSGSFIVPTVPNATKTSVGVIQLGGDLNGLLSTALSPQLSSLQGTTLSISAPSANQVLLWNGSAWVNSTLAPATTSLPGTILLSTASSVSTGDIGGTYNNTKVIGLQGVPISSSSPSSGNVLVFNGTNWAPGSSGAVPQATVGTTTAQLGVVTLGGDFNGSGTTATVPRIGGINGATVPAAGALTTGHVLQVSGTATLTYGFINDANVAAAAAIAGTKINPAFGTQNISTTGTASFGATTTGALTASTSGSTTTNILNGALRVTIKTLTSLQTTYSVDTTSTDNVIFVPTNLGAFTITLPSPTIGRKLIIKDSTGNASISNAITMNPFNTDKIEGFNVAKKLTSAWGSWTFVSNGTDWFMI